MASMNTNNNDRTPQARQVEQHTWHEDGSYGVEELDWEGRNVDVFNDSFGNVSVRKVVKDFQRDNYGKKYIEDLELAQKLTRCDEDTWNSYSWQEQLDHGADEQRALQNVVLSSRNKHNQKTINNDTKMSDLKNNKTVELKKKLQKKYDDALEGMLSDIKTTKNAKRNAKRRAKAKRTKMLNFTPTKEQEEWFWGGAPHGGDE